MTQEHSDSQVYDAVWQVVTRRSGERAAAAVELLDELIHGHGRLRRHEQELIAGERVLNDDRELLSRVARATSMGLNLYLGNRRIASASSCRRRATSSMKCMTDSMRSVWTWMSLRPVRPVPSRRPLRSISRNACSSW